MTDVELEWPIGGQRADVYAVIGGVKVAFEVQVSTLRPDDLARRTTGYTQAGVAVCWLHPYESGGISDGISAGRYSPKDWERWIHAANFGRCYYWTEGLWVLPVHFDKHHLEVEYRSWYDQDGQEQSAGGYARVSRRFRTPVPGNLANIVSSFGVQARSAFVSERTQIPACRIYIDRQSTWWTRSS